jgi:flagellar basal-body rod modification protein FlgD
MLTTQLQNQDPLDPVDSSDYAVQLATFSGVEQQVRTNNLLADLARRFDLLGMAQLSGWVGQEALTTAPVRFDGTPVTLIPDPVTGADSAVLVITDATGALVARETIPVDGEPYLWLGADAAGNPLPRGAYTISVESQRAGQVVETSPVASYARIEEARRGDTGVILRLAGGQEVDSSDILGLRIP